MRGVRAISIAWALACACSSKATTEAPVTDRALPSCGALEAPTADGSCASVAIDKCGTGFRKDDGGGCAAILPAAPCAKGQMALPGDEACKPVASCGADTFGDLPKDANTLYVDHAAAAGGDGTRDKPFHTIAEALAVTTVDNPVVAIAAGTYEENLVFTRPARLYGRCPEMVEIKGSGTTPTIDGGKTPFEVHRVSITGSYIGLRAYDTTDVRIEEVRVHDTTERAFDFEGPNDTTEVALHRVLVESPAYAGVVVAGAAATIDDLVVRDVKLRGGSGGFGVSATVHDASGESSTLDLRHSVISGAKQAAVGAYGSKVTVRDVLLQGTGFGKGTGFGLFHAPYPKSGACGPLDVDGLVVDGAHDSGITVRVCDGTIANTVVRHVATNDKGQYGQGVQIAQSKSQLDHLLIEDVQHVGFVVDGGNATVHGIIVRRVEPAPFEMGLGVGISAIPYMGSPSTLALFGAVVSDVHTTGILSAGATLTVDGAHVFDVKPAVDDGRFGDGVVSAAITVAGAPQVGTISLTHGRIERVARAGLLANGGDVTVGSTAIVCTAFPLDIAPQYEGGTREETKLEDGGENRCIACDGSEDTCLAQSSNLAPIKIPTVD
ncbi:MAG: DUF1565 domain-containing protein [Polyangiales bacterium]